MGREQPVTQEITNICTAGRFAIGSCPTRDRLPAATTVAGFYNPSPLSIIWIPLSTLNCLKSGKSVGFRYEYFFSDYLVDDSIYILIFSVCEKFKYAFFGL